MSLVRMARAVAIAEAALGAAKLASSSDTQCQEAAKIRARIQGYRIQADTNEQALKSFLDSASGLVEICRTASDADRILPGDGDFQFEPLVARLREIDYSGYVSVELMNPQIWRVGPRQFGEIAMTALRKTLGQASMQ